MPVCPNCNIQFDWEAVYCAQCGRKIADVEDSSEVQSQIDIPRLLAEANLSRFKKQYAEAITQASEVLKIDPENIDCHILLAKIYEEKGDFDEAARWYRMAMDINPNDKAIKESLEAITAKQTQKPGIDRHPLSQESWYDRISRSPKFKSVVGYSTLAIIAIALAFIAGSIVALVIWGPVREVSTAPPSTQSLQKNVPLPSKSQTASPQSENASVIQQVHPLSEQQLITQLNMYNSAAFQSGSMVENIEIDPRHKKAFVSVRIAAANPDQTAVVRAAAVVSSALFAASPEINEVSVRVIAGLPDDLGVSQWNLAFIGDISRARAASTDTSKATFEQNYLLFENPWINPRLAKAIPSRQP